MRMAIACLVVLVTLPAGQGNASAQDVTGELRVLYALVTWGPTPFAPPDAERVAAETADYFHSSSDGRLSLSSSVVGPLRLPRGVFDSCDATVTPKRNAGIDLRGLRPDRVRGALPRHVQLRRRGEPDRGAAERPALHVACGPRTGPHARTRAREPVGLPSEEPARSTSTEASSASWATAAAA